MNKTKSIGVWVTGSVATILLGASFVQAEESHWIAGSACEAANSGYAAQVVGGFGAVGNQSTAATLQISCPMAPDHFNYSFIEVTVSATKKTAASMACAVVSRDFTNTSGVITSKSLTGTGVKAYNFPDIDTQQWLFHTVRCDIPKAGSSNASTRTLVNGYNYREYN